MGFGWLVTVVLALHFAYLGYLVLGGFLAWRWPAAFWPHLASAVWGVLILSNTVNCPLTWAEGRARELAGQAPQAGGFIDRYVTGVIYPDRYVVQVRIAVALVVLVAWTGAFLRWRRRRESLPSGHDRGDTAGQSGAKSGPEPGRAATV